MNKENYIESIEKINEEYIRLYYSREYRKVRRNKKLKTLLKNFYFKKFYYTITTLIINKFIKYDKTNNPIINEPKKKQGKKVVYTCITGGYDELSDPILVTENVDYIVFSDTEEIINNTKVWQFKRIPKKVVDICNNNPLLINRYIKMHPQEMLPEYDISLYIDGSIKIVSDIEDCFYLINDNTGLALHDHSKRQDVYQEAKACIYSHLGNKKNIKKLVDKYKKEGFPEKFGLFEATFIACDLNNEKSKQIFDMWWDEFIKSGTLRDQMCFTHVLWKNGYKYEDIGLLGKSASLNPKFRRYEHDIKPRKSVRLIIKTTVKKTLPKLLKTKFYLKIIKPIITKINKKRFNGTRYECNICKNNLRRMRYGGNQDSVFIENEIIGMGERRNYKCPVCKTSDKERMIYYYIENYTDILTEKNTILYFEPEYEIKTRILKNKKIKYYDSNIQKEKKLNFIDITNICFDNDTFDYIICDYALQKVSNENKALSELKRVVKPDGTIILTVPVCISNETTIEDEEINSETDRKKYYFDEKSTRLYGKDIVSRFEKEGLKVKEYDLEQKEGRETRRKHGILEKGKIYLITK